MCRDCGVTVVCRLGTIEWVERLFTVESSKFELPFWLGKKRRYQQICYAPPETNRIGWILHINANRGWFALRAWVCVWNAIMAIVSVYVNCADVEKRVKCKWELLYIPLPTISQIWVFEEELILNIMILPIHLCIHESTWIGILRRNAKKSKRLFAVRLKYTNNDATSKIAYLHAITISKLPAASKFFSAICRR